MAVEEEAVADSDAVAAKSFEETFSGREEVIPSAAKANSLRFSLPASSVYFSIARQNVDEEKAKVESIMRALFELLPAGKCLRLTQTVATLIRPVVMLEARSAWVKFRGGSSTATSISLSFSTS